MLVGSAAAGAQQPVPGAPAVLDGPDPAISLPAGLGVSVARDGTGGIVYLRQVAGIPHVFVSTLVGGGFGAPVELDAGLPAAASQPVIAAGNGGLLLIAFVSGGQLYVVSRPNPQAAFAAPAALASGAASPSISMSNFGKAYLAFSVADGSGQDIRDAYYYNGSWALEPMPLNATPGDDAGAGTGRPSVATAGDGEGVIAWGESGSILVRRVWGTQVSPELEQADGAVGGCTEVRADDPVVGAGGDSSYADVAFHEVLSCGGAQQSRVLMNRLVGSSFEGLTQPDGLSPGGSEGAQDPQITMGEYGRGLVTSERTPTNNAYVTALGANGAVESTYAVNSLPESAAPDPVVATAGLFSNLVSWQQTPGAAGAPDIRVRYAPSASSLGSEMVVSSPSQGASDASDGLAAGGDINGDSLVSWVQSTAGGPEIVAARLYQPPGGFSARKAARFQPTAHPRLAWSPAQEPWGPLTYTVSVDGTQVGQTTATSLTVPATLADGPHSWAVTATNPAGQQSSMPPAQVFVDTMAPQVTLRSRRRLRLGARIILRVLYADLPPAGEPPGDASGVVRVRVRWGDGTVSSLRVGSHSIGHVYRRARRYAITTIVTDAAGNSRRATLRVRVIGRSPATSGGRHR